MQVWTRTRHLLGSGSQHQPLPTHVARVPDALHTHWPTEMTYCRLTILGRGHHIQQQKQPSTVWERRDGKGHTRAEVGADSPRTSPSSAATQKLRGALCRTAQAPLHRCGCHPCSHFRMKGGTQMASQSDMGHLAPGGSPTSHHPQPWPLWGLPTGRQPQAMGRTAWPTTDAQDNTHRRAIPDGLLWQAYALLVGNHFLEFSRIFTQLSEY